MRVIDEDKLSQVLEFIKNHQINNGKSPSYRVIMKELKIASLSIVARYVSVLQGRGLIKKDDLGGIKLPAKLNSGKTIIAPLIGTVTCGDPIFAYENLEATYKLPADLFGPGELFLLKAKGDSMIDAGIQDGDIVTVDKSSPVKVGDICVALIGEDATVKRLMKKNNNYYLKAENKNYEDIIVNQDELQIIGKVVGYIHKY